MFKAIRTMLLSSAVLAACAFDVGGTDGDFETTREVHQPGRTDGVPRYSEAEIKGLLDLANSADQDELDDDVGLDARAARNIVAHRNGADGVLGTDDDNLFDTLAELDAITYVGPSALTKLLDYAYAAGYIPRPPEDIGCLIISEYIEGQGNYNKALELFNCGEGTITLSNYSLCLVRNDAGECTDGEVLPEATLAAGSVFTICRTTEGTFNDPVDGIRDNCDAALGGVMTFNGDDRLMVFHDLGGDGELDADEDTLLDSFGDASVRPDGTPWSDLVLRRCDLTPYTGGEQASFDAASLFTQHARHDATDFGAAPSDSGCPDA